MTWTLKKLCNYGAQIPKRHIRLSSQSPQPLPAVELDGKILLIGDANIKTHDDASVITRIDQPDRLASDKTFKADKTVASILDDPQSLISAIKEHSKNIDLVIISSALENILDPKALLRVIKQLLLGSLNVRCQLHIYSNGYYSPVHKWTSTELESYLNQMGFVVNIRTMADEHFAFDLSIDPNNYSDFLRKRGLPQNYKLKKLVISKNLSVEAQHDLQIKWSAIISKAVHLEFNKTNPSSKDITLSKIAKLSRGFELTQSDTALAISEELLSLYPYIEEVYYTDFLGVGARLAQAKRCGTSLLNSMELTCLCIGTSVYLEHKNQQWLSYEKVEVSAEEKVSIEYADRILFSKDSMSEVYLKLGYQLPSYSTQLTFNIANASPVTVIVPILNTPIEQISDLCLGLNSQVLAPKEVIFINDGSDNGYEKKLNDFLQTTLKLPYKIINHEQNMGLAVARNTGLQNTTTDILANIDSDDIPGSMFLYELVKTFDLNPDIDVACHYYESFLDGSDWQEAKWPRPTFHPLGEGSLVALELNTLAHANSAFRVSTLNEFKGWDASNKHMYEDWALYLKMLTSGKKILIIPKTGSFYRMRPDSMLRTYPLFPATQRLAENLSGLRTFDKYRLMGILRSHPSGNKVHGLHLNSKYSSKAVRAIQEIDNNGWRSLAKLGLNKLKSWNKP